uniref:hypothetical protein n=1 Tax=Bacillus velezensis TaxID=492670 RepID=UPI0011A169F7
MKDLEKAGRGMKDRGFWGLVEEFGGEGNEMLKGGKDLVGWDCEMLVEVVVRVFGCVKIRGIGGENMIFTMCASFGDIFQIIMN